MLFHKDKKNLFEDYGIYRRSISCPTSAKFISVAKDIYIPKAAT